MILNHKPIWFADYIRTTDDNRLIWRHFIKDFLFHHGLRYMVYFRLSQTCRNRLIKLFYEYKLFRLCRKHGIEIKTRTKIGPGVVLTHPYNITISPLAVIGKNVNICL